MNPEPTPCEDASRSGSNRRKSRSAKGQTELTDPSERRRLPLLLRRAWYGLNQAFRHVTTQAGITPDQFTVLRNLHELAPETITQRQLAERMSSDANTIASLLRRMETQALVQRQSHPDDGRAHRVVLQPAGRKKFANVKRKAMILQRTILGALPEAERELFLARLELVANACWEASQTRRARSARKGSVT